MHTDMPAGHAVGALYRYTATEGLSAAVRRGLLTQNGLASFHHAKLALRAAAPMDLVVVLGCPVVQVVEQWLHRLTIDC